MIADLTPEQLKARYEPKPARVAATERQLHAAQFTPGGTRLIGGGYDSLVRLWDVTAKEPAELATSDTHQGWVQGLALHPTEKFAYTADSFGRLQCLGYANDTLDVKWYLDNAHDGWIRVVAINKDASTLVSAGRDKTIRSWNPVDGAARSTRNVEGADIYQCVFHPDGKRFASGDAHGTVTLWSVDQQAPLGKYDASELFSVQRLQDVGGVHTLMFSLDGAELFVGGTRPKNGGNVQGEPLLLVFDVETQQLVETIELGPASDVYVQHVQQHMDGFLIAATSGNPNQGKLHLLRRGDKEPFSTTTNLSNCHHISIHPSGDQLAVTTTSPGSNGNGRPLKDGQYVGNHTRVHLLDFPNPKAAPE